jgi:hypothetical protein
LPLAGEEQLLERRAVPRPLRGGYAFNGAGEAVCGFRRQCFAPTVLSQQADFRGLRSSWFDSRFGRRIETLSMREQPEF